MTEKRDYRDTVFLPKTDFPMKAGLPQKEPGIAARWQEIGLYDKLRESRKGREKFIFHDGPPYANGDMHIGHALNHTLKDMVCRTQNLLGKDAPYVPGWDCHGLPIEWKVEEQYRKDKKQKPVLSGKDRNEAEVKAFRDECRAYAQHWVDVQRDQLKRLGVMADWDHPYLTMQKESEAIIVAELMKLAEAGNLYRGSKPVMWSPVEETALAEAEVEYEDIVSTQIDVAFEITESPIEELVGAHAVIWTTTPWTIPVNQALAYGPEVEYVHLRLLDDDRHPSAQQDLAAKGLGWLNGTILVAKALFPEFYKRVSATAASQGVPIVDWPVSDEGFGDYKIIKGSDLAGTVARHPMHKLGGFYAKPRPFLPGDFVTTDSGTGLVHMAPDHGEDDFELCKANGIEPVFAVTNGGVYRDDWGWLGGDDERRRSVINKPFNSPEGPICSDLREAGALLAASEDYQHSYPHSWRSKAKVIFRCTPQWFVPMDKPLGTGDFDVAPGNPLGAAVAPFVSQDHSTLRQRAVQAIADTRFVPEKGRNRLGSMVEGRPDWVLSRQRAWGVPITLFVRQDGSYLQDPAVNARVVAAVREEGMDAWNEGNKAAFLGADHDPAEFEMVSDILDVWFDSGCTHAFVLESGRWGDVQWPADLYLEGSDQHRGWFQSSLLESCATRGRAPYNQVLTHGFTMASDGRKMSKSLGNTVDPLKVMEQYGADIIRLWALSVDFTEDHRIGDEILKGVADQYRKLRNTFRYLLGALDGFDGSDVPEMAEFPELERYVLTLLSQLDAKLAQAIVDYDFNTYTRALIDFANEDLSAFFFDIRKDCLYCDGEDSVTRRAYRATLDILFQALVRYVAPVLVFTSEEVWATRYPADIAKGGSVHLLEWPKIALAEGLRPDTARWEALRELREDVNEAIEPLRREKTIRSSLEADVVVPASAVPEGFSDADLAALFITASVTRGQGDSVSVTKTTDHKCGRCWRLLPEVEEDGDLCARCEEVVE
ncbi:Isoleucyl-tRNA synthetase [Altererythrobacter epoxidivorans]|uniref:Isoleucine--tRNA ligase n=1 Tax=Altererythrobacter epoxidivorans TaxID=361183 RepID=A0A0M5L0Y8_9SPHN|nr:isoleucine--tRNA ligase [Altererythrobacter epoxidivorans]ALE17919.1 Isoleucyl-tRNA synthetase [Altererythrobacter epoxidivorans]